MSLLFLNRRDVQELLTPGECIDCMAEILAALGQGEASQPLRALFWLPGEGRRDLVLTMPSERSAPAGKTAVAVKVLTIFEGNHGFGLDSHLGFVLLFDGHRGEPLALLDAASLTALRTAAASALATRLLAREDAGDLAMIGTGVQARTHITALREVRQLRRIRVYSRDLARAQSFAADEAAHQGLPVEAAATVEAAVAGADLICTVTASRVPVLHGEWLSPGVHINAVGACTPVSRELDTAAVAGARFFGDLRESVLKEAGDFLIPLSDGAFGQEHLLGDLPELLLGKVAGRVHRDDITIFESLGIAVEDLAAAQHVYDKALQLGRGVRLEL